MKILVTGGAGYVGSTIATRLIEEGHGVVVADDLTHSDAAWLPKGAEFINRPVADLNDVLDPSFDAVVHCAGYIEAGESMGEPEKYWQSNFVSSLALLDAMVANGITTIVFSSSAGVYAEGVDVPIVEDAACDPASTYGATKLAVDLALRSYAFAHDMAAVSLRYFNVAGAYRDHDGVWHGENHVPETHLIPITLEVAAGQRDQLTVFGSDYPTRDGSCIRDYIHVGDLADAHAQAIEYAKPGRHDVFNLGSGTGYTNKEIVAAVRTVTGREVPVVDGPRRPGDPAQLIASSEKAKTVLGWSPTRDDLETIVADAWAYFQHRQEQD
ncbi:UDP-glucose 4-epimerase GalE [Haloglycomyces albus]|uniref:UDP-glucose 4-epimerase GalE n=1 Tax=Haloglycomyces albus TaxID=526067 RepID=UPI00046CF474|nr:UDP-glucose 4-epimerase GalE [Haloglycomyces albus]